jgi:hypothetical protein
MIGRTWEDNEKLQDDKEIWKGMAAKGTTQWKLLKTNIKFGLKQLPPQLLSTQVMHTDIHNSNNKQDCKVYSKSLTGAFSRRNYK